jgi:hypothetical protein
MPITPTRGSTSPQLPRPQPKPQPAALTQPTQPVDSFVHLSGDPKLDKIATARLRAGSAHTCVTTVRANLARLGFKGLPSSTSQDANNPRGMMVQMLQSGQWKQPDVGGTATTITSPYGTVSAQVLTRDEFTAAVQSGAVADGSVVFQTEHGWDYNGGSRGNDVGILQNGAIFNSVRMRGTDAYGANSGDFVVLQPQ